jgi:hypothetical protein
LLGIRFDQPDFLRNAISVLRSGGAGAKATRILLDRFVPEGAVKGADPSTWERWIERNGPYMFFSESGGFRWDIDPLALKRQAPTAKLSTRIRNYSNVCWRAPEMIQYAAFSIVIFWRAS